MVRTCACKSRPYCSNFSDSVTSALVECQKIIKHQNSSTLVHFEKSEYDQNTTCSQHILEDIMRFVKSPQQIAIRFETLSEVKATGGRTVSPQVDWPFELKKVEEIGAMVEKARRERDRSGTCGRGGRV